MLIYAGLILSAISSAEEVLAPGPPALKRGDLTKIVSLLEWGLETSLTPAQRTEIERTQVGSWQSADAQTRQNFVALAKMADVIAVLPEAQKAQVKQQLKQTLGAALAPKQAARQATAFPPDLAGEWSSVHTSTVQFTDRTTGSFAPPSGNGMQYKFFPDGRYQSAGLIQSSMYNCTMTVNAFEEGTIEIKGNLLTFHSRGGTLDSKDNCNSSFNYRKPIPANDNTYAWRIDRDQWGTRFCIVKEGVKEDCAYKK